MKLGRAKSTLLVFALLLVFGATARAQTDELAGLDVAALVAEAHRHGARMADHINEYTWTETAKLRLYDRRGKLKEETPLRVWEIFPNRVSGRVNVYFDGVFSDYHRFGTEFDSYKLTTPTKAQD